MLGAYDLANDRLLVSGDLCVDELSWLKVVGSKAWAISEDGMDLVATPYALDAH